MNIFKNIILSMRPSQWIKNGLLFAGLIFSGNMLSLQHFSTTINAFLIFCLGSGCIYILNDINDRQSDQKHPVKKNRPIAAGDLPVKTAWLAAVILFLFSILTALLFFNPPFVLIFSIYYSRGILYHCFTLVHKKL